MKRFLFLAVFSVLTISVFSQQIDDSSPLFHPDAKVEVDVSQMKAYIDAGWFIPAWDLLDFYFGGSTTGIVTHYANLVFPDSIVRYESSSGSILYNWLINVGQVLDPTSEMFPEELSSYQDYRVDSMFVLAWYNIVNTGIPDTLVAEFVIGTPLTTPHFAHTIYMFPPDTLRVSPPRMLGSSTQKGFYAKLTAPDKIIVKYPLTSADSTLQYGKYITFPVGIEVPAGKVIGVSLNFVPGNDYNYNNVLYSYMQGGTLTQELNSFRMGLYSVDNTGDFPSLFYDPFNKYNVSCYTHKNGRYMLYADQWRNERMASLITWGFDFGWKLSQEDNVSVEESIEQLISVYPNPASEILNIETGFSSSTISIVDMHGRIVYCGHHTSGVWSIDISAWAQGIYVVNISGDNAIATKKFVKL